jgi:hypothetical protein
MSLPYIPGWWDSISGNATKLAQQLPQVIQPDNVAQKRLQEMLQQNPMLLEQMSNMDEGTRKQLEQTLGFKKNTPISALPVGAQRQQREMEQKEVAGIQADPTKYQDYLAGKYKVRTEDQRKADGLKIKGAEQEIDINALNMEVMSGKVKDMKRTQADVDAAIAKYPDLSKVNYKAIVREFVRQGRPIDPALLTASINNEGARAALDLGIKTELMSLENEYSMRLRTAKDPNTSALLLRTLTEQANQIEATQQRLLAQRQQALKELEDGPNSMTYKMMSLSKDPAQRKQAMDIYNNTVGKIDEALNTYMQAGIDIQARTEAYGDLIGIPKAEKKETPAERAARLRKAAGM